MALSPLLTYAFLEVKLLLTGPLPREERLRKLRSQREFRLVVARALDDLEDVAGTDIVAQKALLRLRERATNCEIHSIREEHLRFHLGDARKLWTENVDVSQLAASDSQETVGGDSDEDVLLKRASTRFLDSYAHDVPKDLRLLYWLLYTLISLTKPLWLYLDVCRGRMLAANGTGHGHEALVAQAYLPMKTIQAACGSVTREAGKVPTSRRSRCLEQLKQWLMDSGRAFSDGVANRIAVVRADSHLELLHAVFDATLGELASYPGPQEAWGVDAPRELECLIHLAQDQTMRKDVVNAFKKDYLPAFAADLNDLHFLQSLLKHVEHNCKPYRIRAEHRERNPADVLAKIQLNAGQVHLQAGGVQPVQMTVPRRDVRFHRMLGAILAALHPERDGFQLWSYVLADLKSGQPWRSIRDGVFPLLRKSLTLSPDSWPRGLKARAQKILTDWGGGETPRHNLHLPTTKSMFVPAPSCTSRRTATQSSERDSDGPRQDCDAFPPAVEVRPMTLPALLDAATRCLASWTDGTEVSDDVASFIGAAVFAVVMDDLAVDIEWVYEAREQFRIRCRKRGEQKPKKIKPGNEKKWSPHTDVAFVESILGSDWVDPARCPDPEEVFARLEGMHSRRPVELRHERGVRRDAHDRDEIYA